MPPKSPSLTDLVVLFSKKQGSQCDACAQATSGSTLKRIRVCTYSYSIHIIIINMSKIPLKAIININRVSSARTSIAKSILTLRQSSTRSFAPCVSVNTRDAMRAPTSGFAFQQHYDNGTLASASASRSFSSRSKVRRRKRSGNAQLSSQGGDAKSDEERSSANKPSATITDSEKFLESAKAFLHRAEIALEPMKSHNEVFNLIRSSNEEGDNLTVALKPGEGKYVFQVHEDMCTLSLNSPMSGSYTYVLCAYTGQFVGMEDGHSCEGMLVRDLIRHCYGLPQF